MAVLYEACRSCLKNKEGNKLYYPHIVRTGSVNTGKISEEISKYFSLSPGDVKSTSTIWRLR